ncbi:MAG: sodium-dependent bicarbonate transport family permease [Planctomycetota bacterium]
MDPSLLVENLRTPAILFFGLGVLAAVLKSDLSLPQPIPKLLSIYLLMAIGLHGGVELMRSELDASIFTILAAAVVLAAVVPIWSFAVLRFKLDVPNAAAMAATYGSISAVTFITASNFLDTLHHESGNAAYVPGGYMVAAMALMESPAIVVGVLLARYFAKPAPTHTDGQPLANPGPAPGDINGNGKIDWGDLFREAFLNGAVVVLVGSLMIGIAINEKGWKSIEPFAYTPFKGVLCLFLLDMGLVAARRLGDLKTCGPSLIAFAILSAPLHASLGIGVGWLLGLSAGDTLLLAVLSGSASYIAVPAAMRLAVPEANPGLYVTMSLAVTFPFNITLGIPLYMAIIEALWM